MYCDWCKVMNKPFSRDILERKDRKKQADGDIEMTDVSVLAIYFLYWCLINPQVIYSVEGFFESAHVPMHKINPCLMTSRFS